jgi:hypothetical protein
MAKIETARQLSVFIADLYGLTLRCQINLEGTIQNMLFDGVKIGLIKSYLEDIYDNVEFLPGYNDRGLE